MTFPSGALLALSGPDGVGGYRLGPSAADVRSVIADGEYASLSQRADWTDGAPTLLRFRADVRGSKDVLSASQRWRVVVKRDAIDRTDYPAAGYLGEGDGARPYELTDCAVPLLGLVGIDSVVEFSLAFSDSAPAGELDAELPNLVVWDLLLDASTDAVLINRVPSPGQTNVAVGGDGSFVYDFGLVVEVHVPAASRPANHPLWGGNASLWIDGALVWSGSASSGNTTVAALDDNRTARIAAQLGDPLPQPRHVDPRPAGLCGLRDSGEGLPMMLRDCFHDGRTTDESGTGSFPPVAMIQVQ